MLVSAHLGRTHHARGGRGLHRHSSSDPEFFHINTRTSKRCMKAYFGAGLFSQPRLQRASPFDLNLRCSLTHPAVIPAVLTHPRRAVCFASLPVGPLIAW